MQANAWALCELAWLEHLQASLGPAYQLRQEGGAVLLSTLVKFTSDRDIALRHLTDVPTAAAETVSPQRVTVAARPANTTTSAFRGRGGR